MHLSASLPDHTLLTVPKPPSVSSLLALLSDGESASTKSTSQSEQRVKPGRYSALHWGQNMGRTECTTRPKVGHSGSSSADRRQVSQEWAISPWWCRLAPSAG